MDGPQLSDVSFTRRVGELVGWGAVAGVGVVMLTQAFGVNGSRLIATLHALTPYGLPLVAAVCAVAVWKRARRLAGCAAAVGVSLLLLSTPIVFPPSQPTPTDDAARVDIAAVNLLFRNPDVAAVADVMIDVDADVIVFSEYTIEHNDRLLNHPLAVKYPFQVNRDGLFAGGMAVWSKLPINENARPDTINRTIDATITTADGPVRVLAVHPPTPIFDFDAWKADLAQIGATAAEYSDPTLVIGDFNAAYWHPAFRDILRGGLIDAHMANGAGWSTSWPTDEFFPPFVRLDHALTGNGLVSTDVADFHVPGSDHGGLVVSVAIVSQ